MLVLSKQWCLEEAFKAINGTYHPGGEISGPRRNDAIERWIDMIGPIKANKMFTEEIAKQGSKTKFGRVYQIGTPKLNQLLRKIEENTQERSTKDRFEFVDKAYEFIIEREISGLGFTISELANATGWKESTCRTYPTKRWHQYIDREGREYISTGIRFLSKEEFRAVHSQKLQKTSDHSTKGILLNKAREFALLAVSIYNNPYTEFKTYGFIVNIIISYTALFHAVFEKKGIDYFYKNKDGSNIKVDGDDKAWELSECCNEYWQGNNSPEKANLQFLIGLRNKIEHRSLPAIDLAVSGECQSALSNLENILVSEFGDDYALIANLATAMQLTRISQQAQADALKQMQKENYKVVREYMETYRNDLDDEVLESQKYRIRAFLIPKIGNHAKSSDLSIEFVKISNLSDEEKLSYEKGVAFIKGVESQYRLKPSKVVDAIKIVFPNFNMSLHTKCWKYFDARPLDINAKWKGKYSGFVEGFDGYLYTKEWVEYLKVILRDDVLVRKVKDHN